MCYGGYPPCHFEQLCHPLPLSRHSVCMLPPAGSSPSSVPHVGRSRTAKFQTYCRNIFTHFGIHVKILKCQRLRSFRRPVVSGTIVVFTSLVQSEIISGLLSPLALRIVSGVLLFLWQQERGSWGRKEGREGAGEGANMERDSWQTE